MVPCVSSGKTWCSSSWSAYNRKWFTWKRYNALQHVFWTVTVQWHFSAGGNIDIHTKFIKVYILRVENGSTLNRRGNAGPVTFQKSRRTALCYHFIPITVSQRAKPKVNNIGQQKSTEHALWMHWAHRVWTRWFHLCISLQRGWCHSAFIKIDWNPLKTLYLVLYTSMGNIHLTHSWVRVCRLFYAARKLWCATQQYQCQLI